MRNILFTLLIISAGFISCNSEVDKKAEEQRIRKTFENYKTAILNDDGASAVNFVDKQTIEYYAHILENVRNTDSVALDAMSIMDKLMVFTIRHRTSAEIIKGYEGKDLFIYAVDQGLVAKNSVAQNSMGDVSVGDDAATGKLIANGSPSPYFFQFNKENDQWKLDLTAIFDIGTKTFIQMAEQSGKDENIFLYEILEMTTRRKPDSTIWIPFN